MSGIGTISSPWEIKQALTSPRIVGGDLIYLRGGTYPVNSIDCIVSGSMGRRITFRAYPGERVIIDGSLKISGDYIDWIGTEHVNTSFTDRSANTGGTGVWLSGANCRLINCLVHDFSQGFSGGGKPGGVYGCLFFYNGWDSNLGHGLYPQNSGPDTFTFKDNIVFDNFGYGFHMFATTGDVDYFTLIGNTSFNNGSLRSLAYPNIFLEENGDIFSPIWYENMTYYGTGQTAPNYLGDPDNANNNIQVYDNYFVHAGNSALTLRGTVNDIVRLDGNTFIGTTSGFDTGVWSDNTYLADEPVVGQTYFLRANEFDSNRANLTIYKWSQASTAPVDVSSVFNVGDSIQAHNVQDYFDDIQTLVVAGDGTITVNMQAANRSVVTPVGWSAPATTFPKFGAFVLEKAA